MLDVLVVAGPNEGEVWHDARVDGVAARPWIDKRSRPLTFAKWFEKWLDGELNAVGGECFIDRVDEPSWLAAKRQRESVDQLLPMGRWRIAGLDPGQVLGTCRSSWPAIADRESMARLLEDVQSMSAVLYKMSPSFAIDGVVFANHPIPPVPVLGSPAEESAIAGLEQDLGRSLPPSYRMFLSLHDGVIRWRNEFALFSTGQLSGREYEAFVRKYGTRDRGAILEDRVIGGAKGELTLLLLGPATADESGATFWDGSRDNPRSYRTFWDFLVAWHQNLRDRLEQEVTHAS